MSAGALGQRIAYVGVVVCAVGYQVAQDGLSAHALVGAVLITLVLGGALWWVFHME